ncbi:hypothetical protein K443DRAFT_5612 [Laccaria amethystina LaAM-08-1]|uniref:F-box domain-containing protein n=1 Tax=Laccaria amethystina LaAM-08-1 TaxID=1095629 RepID=A0A0C9WV12_9AGAR|nr:hypothetical protein K443DRAFT_5612 [Laccaria amethystina LaAM-08-1]
MTGLLSLPTELLQDIGAEVGSSAKTEEKDLRLVCKQINFALEPQILSTIELSPIHLSSQVENLATAEPKPTPISKYATQLNILYPLLHQNRILLSEEEAKVRSFLFPAVGSLTGVRKVSLDLYASDPEWAFLLVLDAVASLPLLQDLHLRCWSVPKTPWQLRPLPHIVNFSYTHTWGLGNDRNITIPVARFISWSQPKLKTLTITNQLYDKNIPNFNDFLFEPSDSAFLNITHLSLSGLFVGLDATVIPHLRSLISLHLENIFSPRDQGPGNPGLFFWLSLQLENVHLQEIVTDDVQLALIEYLTSFSGLRRLRLTQASRFMDGLFITMSIPSNPLKSTQAMKGIGASRATDIEEQKYEDDNDHDKDGDEDGNDDDDDDEKDPSTSRGNPNAIWLLLDICAILPVLRTLVLFSASPEGARGFSCGTSSAKHRGRMNIKIANSVKSYGPITSGHAFRISTAWEEFELRCDELGMNVRYRRISRITEH